MEPEGMKKREEEQEKRKCFYCSEDHSRKWGIGYKSWKGGRFLVFLSTMFSWYGAGERESSLQLGNVRKYFIKSSQTNFSSATPFHAAGDRESRNADEEVTAESKLSKLTS